MAVIKISNPITRESIPAIVKIGAKTYTNNDVISNIKISRTGDKNKFFGFGITQKCEIQMIDNGTPIEGDYISITLGNIKYPVFKIDNIKREKKLITIEGYDAVSYSNEVKYVVPKNATNTTLVLSDCLAQLNKAFGNNVPGLVRLPVNMILNDVEINADGSENLHFILNAIAETVGCIYFATDTGLVFKDINSGTNTYEVDDNETFEFKSETTKRLTAVCSATELGDNVIAGDDKTGETQYIRDNPLLTKRKDLPTVLNKLLTKVVNHTLTPFNLKWRGTIDYNTIGDAIKHDNIMLKCFNSTIEYNGGYKQTDNLVYDATGQETLNNPTSIGEAINETYAQVDKAKREISLVASTVEQNKSDIAQLKIKNDTITAEVEKVSSDTNKQITDMNDKITGIEEGNKKTVKSIVVLYALGDSNTNPPATGWNEVSPVWQEGKFIWQKTKTIYQDDTSTESAATCIQGANGKDGKPGKDGINGENGKDGAPGKDGQPGTNGENGKDGNPGKPGENGKDGNGIASTVIEYQLSDNGATPPTGTWLKTPMDTNPDKPYIWTRTTINYTNGTHSTSYTVGTTLKGVEVGSRNLLLKSAVYYENIGYPTAQYDIAESLKDGETVTCQICGQLGKGKLYWALYNSGGSVNLANLESKGNNMYVATFKWRIGGSANNQLYVYPISSETVATSSIKWIKLERGNKPTDYSTAPEDIKEDIDELDKNVNEHTQQLASLKINADSINATVKSLTDTTTGSIESMNNQVKTLEEKVSATMSAKDIQIAIDKSVKEGTSSALNTTTGIVVDSDGITVSKTGQPMKTNMDENGMTIYNYDNPVLDVSNTGVDAENLHATTYLIVGKHTRFEDYGNGTGLFYIG